MKFVTPRYPNYIIIKHISTFTEAEVRTKIVLIQFVSIRQC